MIFFDYLNAKGIIKKSTNDKFLKENLDKSMTFYMGVDPTSDSLHIGHLFAYMTFAKFLKQNHKGILIFGGATAMIGDPSGKSELRNMLSKEQIEYNATCIMKQVINLFDKLYIDKNNYQFINNADFYKDYNYIDFLRDVSSKFSVKKMLKYDTFKKKVENEDAPLSFIEFNYPLMQAYDFYRLFIDHNCTLQIGGSDQWGNITAGTNFIKRMTEKDSYGLTIPIIENSDGKKMGKTENGTIFLDARKQNSSPFEFFQFWRNIDDKDLFKTLDYFTFFTEEYLKELKEKNINIIKQELSYYLTSLIHSEQDAKSALLQSQSAAIKKFDFSTVLKENIFYIKKENLNINIVELCLIVVKKSKTELRNLLKEGAISLNNEKIIESNLIIDDKYIINDIIGIKIGKKYFVLQVK